MKLHRWSGAGNTFFIMDAWTHDLPLREYRAKLAQKLCHLLPHAKTDGLVFLEKPSSENADFAWDFYNDDGSFAEMCGNAARCASAHFYEFVEPKARLRFSTGAGIVESERLAADRILVHMPPLTSPGRFLEEGIFYIDTGVPHIVLEGSADRDLARHWRPQPGGKGSNVTFVSPTKQEIHSGSSTASRPLDTWEAITFERGVEDFTAACGTGATAAAVYLQTRTALSDFTIRMPGGELRVELPKTLKDRPLLSGPVQYDFGFEV